jgi:4-hydroxythreonine-4-phosphate dehydrogenase
MPANGGKLALAVSAGDPAGIGPEIIGKAWAKRHDAGLPAFFAIGDSNSFAPHWDGPVVRIDDPDAAYDHFETALPVLHIHDCGTVTPGKPDKPGAECALHALEMAIGFVRAGRASALVTAPISKTELYKVGFTHPGQTEFIAERCGISGNNAVMMLAGPDLRVVPMTTHIPLSEVCNRLDGRLIRQRVRATVKGLQRNFGIANPRIAFAGLNPHAGESRNIPALYCPFAQRRH